MIKNRVIARKKIIKEKLAVNLSNKLIHQVNIHLLSA